MRREINLRGLLREMAIGIREKLGLAKGLAEGSILNTQLIYKSTTFLPTSVCLIGGCEGGIQELGTRFEGLYMTARVEHRICIRQRSGTHASRRSRKARWALRFCSARLLCARALPAFGVSPSSSEGDFGV